jgi:hypothetical protein
MGEILRPEENLLFLLFLLPSLAAHVDGTGGHNQMHRWISTLLGNLKTSFNGTFRAFNFDKYARRYLGGLCFRFNRRFSLAAITEQIANTTCCCMPCTERDLRVAEVYG